MKSKNNWYRYSFGWFALISYLFFLIIASTHHHVQNINFDHEVSFDYVIPNSDPYADEFQNCKVVQTFYSQLLSKSFQNNFARLTSPDHAVIDFESTKTIPCFSGLTSSLRSPPSA